MENLKLLNIETIGNILMIFKYSQLFNKYYLHIKMY